MLGKLYINEAARVPLRLIGAALFSPDQFTPKMNLLPRPPSSIRVRRVRVVKSIHTNVTDRHISIRTRRISARSEKGSTRAYTLLSIYVSLRGYQYHRHDKRAMSLASFFRLSSSRFARIFRYPHPGDARKRKLSSAVLQFRCYTVRQDRCLRCAIVPRRRRKFVLRVGSAIIGTTIRCG